MLLSYTAVKLGLTLRQEKGWCFRRNYRGKYLDLGKPKQEEHGGIYRQMSFIICIFI
jgi:hypothetical protein